MSYNNKFLILILLLFFSLLAKAVKLPGYYITQDGERIEVTFSVPTLGFSSDIDFINLQHMIKYNINNQEGELRPGQALEYGFDYKGNHIRMVFKKASVVTFKDLIDSSKGIFLQLVEEGYMQYYDFVYQPGLNNFKVKPKYVLQKEDGDLILINRMGFKRNLANYLSDCTILAEKIRNKLLDYKDIILIVREYNSFCSPEIR